MLPLLWNRNQGPDFPRYFQTTKALAPLAFTGAPGNSIVWNTAHIHVGRLGFKSSALRLPVNLYIFFPEMF